MPKGAKFGGRVKGTPNKKTQELIDRAKAMGLDPWEALCEFALNGPPDLRFNAVKEVCSYVYPKRKALEVSGDEGAGLVIKIEDYDSEKK